MIKATNSSTRYKIEVIIITISTQCVPYYDQEIKDLVFRT